MVLYSMYQEQLEGQEYKANTMNVSGFTNALSLSEATGMFAGLGLKCGIKRILKRREIQTTWN